MLTKEKNIKKKYKPCHSFHTRTSTFEPETIK